MIYLNLLHELDRIISTKFKGKYSSVYLRNEHCTTIFFIPISKDSLKMKIQIIHRIHENKSQVVNSFDLAPSQILFDGNDFLATYTGYVSILTNFIPIDITRFSTNIAHRLRKYMEIKAFCLIFPGISRKEIIDQFLEIPSDHGILKILESYGIELHCPNKDSLDTRRKDGQILKNQFIVNFHNQHGEEQIDYCADIDVNSLDDPSKINTKLILRDFPIFVHENSLEAFLTSPSCLLDRNSLFLNFSVLCPGNAKNVFGDLARDAWNAKFDDDQKKYNTLIDKRLEQLQELANLEAEKLSKVKWKSFSLFESAQFYPLKISAREFYGELYNGFTCTFDWPAKMQLISAWKRKSEEKDCLFVQRLPKDLIKYIFELVDKLNHSEILIL
jgi:hypothetical protein